MRFEKSVLVNMPRSELWTFLANTEKFNREIGLPPVAYTFSPQESGGSTTRAEARFMGQKFVWREMPFEWVEPRWFQVQRIYHSGPFREVVGGVRLEERDGRTFATCFAEVSPRNALGKVIAPLAIGKKAAEDFAKACRNFEGYYQRRLKTPFPHQESRAGSLDRERLEAGVGSLHESNVGSDLTERLASFLDKAADVDLIRFRPFDLSDRWGTDRLGTLRLCLLATRAGLLDLEWSVLCPSCRGVKQAYSHLRDLQPRGHCDACNIEYGADFDRYVEVRFTVNPNIRKVEERIYCVGGPMNTPHILAQTVVAAGDQGKIQIALKPGRYRVRSLQVTSPATVAISADSTDNTAVFAVSRSGFSPDFSTLVAGSDLSLRFANGEDCDIQIKLESEAWSDRGASAALVTSLQEFRDLFSSEVLSPGLELSIRNLAVLFSDLKGSTRLYDSIGDAPAYGLVRKHFEFMAERIARFHGAMVKTIGDAVMAAFLHPDDALRAAAAIQADIGDFCAEHPDLPPLILKLGAHCGPCVAVNANEQLDYFGTTVNVAQRVQDQSAGGDMVITDRMLAESRVAAALEEIGVRPEKYESNLKGFEDQFILYRLRFGKA